MSNDFQLRVAEIMCSRLCHDLLSPIGAINNGVEFLTDGDEADPKNAAGLIQISANQALSRLSFYRAAFGAGDQEGTFNWEEIFAILEKCAVQRRVNLIWNVADGEISKKIPKVLGKLLLNLINLAIECLPRGGVVSIHYTGIDLPYNLEVQVKGPKCILRDDVRSGLQPDLSLEELSARNILAYLVASFAISLDRSLVVTDQPQETILIRMI